MTRLLSTGALGVIIPPRHNDLRGEEQYRLCGGPQATNLVVQGHQARLDC